MMRWPSGVATTAATGPNISRSYAGIAGRTSANTRWFIVRTCVGAARHDSCAGSGTVLDDPINTGNLPRVDDRAIGHLLPLRISNEQSCGLAGEAEARHPPRAR